MAPSSSAPSPPPPRRFLSAHPHLSRPRRNLNLTPATPTRTPAPSTSLPHLPTTPQKPSTPSPSKAKHKLTLPTAFPVPSSATRPPNVLPMSHPVSPTFPPRRLLAGRRPIKLLVKPNAQLVTSAAAAVVLFAVLMLFRSAAIVPPTETFTPQLLHHPHFNHRHPSQPSERQEHQQTDTELHTARRLVKATLAANPNITRLVSSDGAHFLVDLASHRAYSPAFRVDIRPTGLRSKLRVAHPARADAPFAPLAFFLQVSSSNIAMLPRLLVKLHHPRHTFVLHLDKKIGPPIADQVRAAIRAIPAFRTNVFFIPSDDITYKGVSMLLNSLNAIEFLLALPSREWLFFINLSASDYPLVNSAAMARILATNYIAARNQSFLQISPNRQFWSSLKRSRFNYIYFDTALASTTSTSTLDEQSSSSDSSQSLTGSSANPSTLSTSSSSSSLSSSSSSTGDDANSPALISTWLHHPLDYQYNHMHNVKNRKYYQDDKHDILRQMQFIQAEAWIVGHRDFVRYAVHSPESRRLLLFLSLMQDPEEHFFPMLAWNNMRFNGSLAHHAFRGIFWDFQGKMAGQHPYYVDRAPDPTAPNGTAAADEFAFWPQHIRSSPCFFVRKVSNVASPLLDRIDQHMSGSSLAANTAAVKQSLRNVLAFVQCISKVPRPAHAIHSYNECPLTAKNLPPDDEVCAATALCDE